MNLRPLKVQESFHNAIAIAVFAELNIKPTKTG